MIPESFVELRRLQVAAIVELKRLEFPASELERASTVGEVLQATSRAGLCVCAARSLALHLPGNVYGRALDLTAPAALALDALHDAALDEFCTAKREAC